ncbi:unnamed protein product [Arctia plantaginis]|uniref:Peptidase S1 domain-containing protein n=1 Tax=Arctia plantaginis TaxID=874455 RepID=A0A8S1B7Z8_ARCPL|nr:unnamed protein product [Arctia plantaginis]
MESFTLPIMRVRSFYTGRQLTEAKRLCENIYTGGLKAVISFKVNCYTNLCPESVNMKVATLIMVLNFVLTECINDGSIPAHSAYNYLKKISIPEANRIRKVEEKYNSQQRIVGGAPADYGQYPYQVGLVLSITNLTGVGACGGTVLSENRILTAAHCWFDGVNQVSKATIILGSVFLFYGGVRTESSFAVTHPNWTPVLARNDIAVIYLPNSISFSRYIAPVALPSGDELNADFVGAIAIASGFGVTNDNDIAVDSPILNFVHLNVIENEICEMIYPLVVQSTNICTSDNNGGSTCRGDSGGPLVVERNGRSVIIGVTSFGSILDDIAVDSPILNFVHLNVIENEICEMIYPLVVQSTNICTSDNNGGSTCRGDSGGPLVVERNGRSVIIGVTSFGSILGCQLGLPSVFARVTSYITFIHDNL